MSFPSPIHEAVESVRALLHVLPEAARKKALARLDAEAAVLLRAPASAQSRIAAALVEQNGPLAPALSGYRVEEGLPLCPAYPHASRAHQAAIVLGKRPAELFPGLTAAEAHAYLSTVQPTLPARWLIDEAARSLRGMDDDACRFEDYALFGHARPDSIPVARWLIACARDPERRAALLRDRTERVAGVEVRGQLSARLDEIRAEDLDAQRPERTSVRDAFERAGLRAYRAWEREVERDPKGTQALAPSPTWAKRLPRYARLLLSSRALLEEGRAMSHCVGTYVPAVRQGRCFILSICLRARVEPGGAIALRSTAEIDPRTMVVHQHRGPGNATPHPLCEAALRKALARAFVQFPQRGCASEVRHEE